MKKTGKIIVIGGGLGGLWATMRIAEMGSKVDLFSLFPVKRSHSACAQGGINGCIDTKGQNDSIWQHVVDTIKGGDYCAHQPPIKNLCEEAPLIIRAFERMGVPFSRTPEGIMDLRLFGGVKNRRTAFSGATTGQQLLYAVDEQVRKYKTLNQVKMYEWWEFLSVVKDNDGRCVGIVAMDLRTMKVEYFQADAVILATGGLCVIYGQSTNSVNSTGAAASRVYQQGAKFTNGEFIQFHPTAMPGEDKNRLMSEASRGEGGRIWVPKDPSDKRKAKDIPDADRFYFLEEWYPAYGNTVPRDVAARSIFKVVQEMKLGVGGEACVYLDLTHNDAGFLRRRLGGILEIYEKFAGEDPTQVPMKIYPSAHYSMGGLWVDWELDEANGTMKKISPKNHQTSIPGLFACGECDGAYHGANRLGANSLLSASFSGKIAGAAAVSYLQGLEKKSVASSVFEKEKKRQEDINNEYMKKDGKENPFVIHKELGELMKTKVGIVRDNKTLDEAIEGISKLQERFKNISMNDSNGWSNQSLQYTRQVEDMLVLAKVIATSARKRDECRGSHYKPEFELKIPEGKYPGDPEFEEYRAKWKENNEKWLKASVVTHSEDGPQVSYEKLDLSVLPPKEPRDYR